MKYIKIANWDKFQHYKARNPPWYKLLAEIIDEFDQKTGEPKKFYSLPDTAKLTFVLLGCLRTRYDKQIPYKSNAQLKKMLGINTLNLQPLIDKGFITVLSPCYQGANKMLATETETETERDTEREKEGEKETNTSLIFDFWNSFKKGGKWKSHSSLAPEIEDAIKLQLKKYSVDQLKSAISNYARILQNSDCVWSHAWTLREFLTRSRPGQKGELQLYRFLPHSFELKDFLTRSAISRSRPMSESAKLLAQADKEKK